MWAVLSFACTWACVTHMQGKNQYKCWWAHTQKTTLWANAFLVQFCFYWSCSKRVREILCSSSRPRDPLSWCCTSTSISSPDRNVTGIRGSYGPQLAGCAFRSEPVGGGQNSPICVLDCSNPICWGGWIQTSKDQEQSLLLTRYQGKIAVLHWLVENVPNGCVYIYTHAYVC